MAESKAPGTYTSIETRCKYSAKELVKEPDVWIDKIFNSCTGKIKDICCPYKGAQASNNYNNYCNRMDMKCIYMEKMAEN